MKNTLRQISLQELLKKLGSNSYEECITAIQKGYKRYPIIINKTKKRFIEEPNLNLKKIQRKLLEILQNELPCPEYCQSGYKHQKIALNAKKHLNKREMISLDISKYYPSTSKKYIKSFFKDKLGVENSALDLLVQLTTYENHIPTGAPTSGLLAFWSHKDIFDDIDKKMKELDITFTLYADDIVLSTQKHMGNWVIKYINNSLKRHGLKLNSKKIKRFSYKNKIVTGVNIPQSNKMEPCFNIGHSIINDLKLKKLDDMKTNELQSIISKISYIQQFQPNKFKITKTKAVKILRKIIKQNCNYVTNSKFALAM